MSTKQLPDIRAEAEVTAAARFMVLWDTDEVEVYSEGEPIGIVTARDIIRHIANERPCDECVADVIHEDDIAPVEKPLRRDRTSLEPLTARAVMSSPAIACTPLASIFELAELLSDREISGVPVVDDEHRLLGVVSERDVSQALGAPLLRLAIKHPRTNGPFLRSSHRSLTAKDIMSTSPLVAGPDTELQTVADLMISADVNRIPIVADGRVVGVVTRGDVLRAVAGAPASRPVTYEHPIVIGP